MVPDPDNPVVRPRSTPSQRHLNIATTDSNGPATIAAASFPSRPSATKIEAEGGRRRTTRPTSRRRRRGGHGSTEQARPGTDRWTRRSPTASTRSSGCCGPGGSSSARPERPRPCPSARCDRTSTRTVRATDDDLERVAEIHRDLIHQRRAARRPFHRRHRPDRPRPRTGRAAGPRPPRLRRLRGLRDRDPAIGRRGHRPRPGRPARA